MSDMELLQTIGGYAGAIVTIIGLVALIIKPIREYLIKLITKESDKEKTSERLAENSEQLKQILDSVNKLTAQNEVQSEALVSVIRNTIMHLYYKYNKCDEISMYERENIEKLYKAYKALGGNSFVADCVEEIRHLPVKM
jgi:DNA polymerase II small subunit/DNA polymerase delta subunit B